MASDDQAPATLILDLSVSANQFISDHRTQALASQLQEAGHEAVVARGVIAGDEDLNILRSFVSQRHFDPVIMVHAWDRDLVQTVRAGMAPGSRLLRITDGVQAALDDEFDFVVNDAQLLDLLGGNLPSDGGAWKPTSAGELRRQGPDTKLNNPGNIVEWVTLRSDSDVPERPTISGPSPGCPFLLDTRANPIYDDVEMDPKRIQTRGCSFCLDNFGAYTVSSEADTVDSWLEQIRTVREQRSDVREFLLTDERPHPFLPAFFRALTADPSIAPVELLIKSRIDWLLEYADGELSDAARAAAEGGHVLHVYLIGFENFEQFHLDLFNKGVTVADNVEAIDKIRQLDARFPASFEYRRLRAHGIVLFTPWTKPDQLIENARVMRDVNFEEFRSDSLDTRLRLYPRVPLHSKAEQDGLLLESFPSGRPDRATEQGYDASVPWRFADRRTEAVFQLARALSKHSHSDLLEDADLLELAAHFVLRWPGLANAPDLVHLAFLAVVGNPARPDHAQHMREMIDVDATAALMFDRELEGIQAGLKQASLREGVPLEHRESLVEAYRAMGFAAGVASRQGSGLDSGSGVADGDEERVIIAVAASQESLDRAIEFDAVIHERRPGREDAVRKMGQLLGYPQCCVAAFAEVGDHSDNLQLERSPFLRSRDRALDPLVNRLAMGASLVSHHLCTPDCAPSARNAKTLLDRLESASATGAAWTRERLSEDRLVFGYDAQVALKGSWNGDSYDVNTARAIGSAAQPELWTRAGSFTIDADGADVALTGGSHVRVAAPNPLMVTPGRAMTRAALAALSNPSSVSARPAKLQGPDTFDTDSDAGQGSAPPNAFSPEATAAFLQACFGSDTAPVDLGDGALILAAAPSRSKAGFDLELANSSGDRLRAYVVRSRDGEPAYAQSKWLSLAYYGGGDDTDGPSPTVTEALMNALRATLVAGEKQLDESTVDALFTTNERSPSD